MKCLTVQQPWAWLLVTGQKDVENRSWDTGYRGPLLIHAGKRLDRAGYDWLRRQHGIRLPRDPNELDLGVILGRVTLVDCTWRHSSAWHEQGSIGWYVERAMRLEVPIRWRGQLGLFEVPDEQTRHAVWIRA